MIILTDEQRNIIYSDSPLIFVSARAGTGKTTTLVEFSKLRKADTIIYIVYNNSIKEEARGKFPSHVRIETAHSLAFSYIKDIFGEKITDNLTIEDTMENIQYFKENNQKELEKIKIAVMIMKVLSNFFNSNTKSISDLNFNPFYLEKAQEYWEKMIDKENLECKITHDGYLKYYQLSEPILDYDYIMVDEAQDSNEAMLDIVFRQKSNKIFVGDPHQKIYGFRGALNVFNEKKYISISHEDFSLTESFRFGSEVANVANFILSDYKNEKILIKGCDRESVVGNIDKEYQYTIITRTNTYLFDQAINFVKEGKKIFIVGGVDSILNQILDAYYLYKNKRSNIKSNYFKTISSFNALKELAQRLKIPEYMFLVRIIDKYGDMLFDYISLIKKNNTGKKTADVILTTAHKSKGLEFSTVLIGEDFPKLEKIENSEEFNILYVAVTRATHDLELNDNLKKLIV